MVNAQKWLNENYPKNAREKIEKLDLSDENLNDKLVIEGFSGLKEIKCRNNKDLTSIELDNLSELEIFDANNCKLSDIKIEGCRKIRNFNVANNLLSNLNFLNSLNHEELTILSLHTNNFSERDLRPFSKFTNLQRLFLDNNSEEKFKEGYYNRFSGSLEPLKGCKDLELLSIGNTDISEGLEHLPDNFKKIGLDAKWEEKSGYLRIRQELVEAADFLKKVEKLIKGWGEKDEETTEIITSNGKKLKSKNKDEYEGYFNDYYKIAPWKKERALQKGDLAQKIFKLWIDKNYPKDDVCKRQEDKDNQGKKREEIKKLSIRGLNFWGSLKIEGFTGLEKLDCSFNWFTDLDLSSFRKLVKLDCSNNKLENLNFLNSEKEVGLHYPEKLHVLRISGNNFKDLKDLKVFSEFKLTGLRELSIENCPFEGSLENLKNLDRLQKIYISHTNIGEGLEKLPSSCREVYCDFDYQTKNKSINIVRELGKHLELGEDESGTRYYNLEKWKEEKQGGVATIIPLERLYIIRSNIKKFIDRWGVKKDESDDGSKKIIKLNESNLSELSKLRHPDEFSIQWWLITGLQWTNRATSVVGGGLVFVGQSDTNDPHSQLYTQLGGVIAIASPFIETITSYVNEKVYGVKQTQWDEFLEDAKNLLNSYHELMGMVTPVDVGSGLGGTRGALYDLKKEVEEFLKKYDDKDQYGHSNGIISIDELVEKRKKLAQDLAKAGSGESSQLDKIAKAIQNLESAINDYRQTLYNSMNETEVARKRAEKEIKEIEKLDASALNEEELKCLWKDQGSDTWKVHLENLKEPEEIRQFYRNVIDKANKKKEQKFIQDWVEISGSDRKETGLVIWLIEEKSKEDGNYADPQWVKNNLKKVRKEYEEYKKTHIQYTQVENNTLSLGSKEAEENHYTIDLDKHFEQQETQIQISPKSKQ